MHKLHHVKSPEQKLALFTLNFNMYKIQLLNVTLVFQPCIFNVCIYSRLFALFLFSWIVKVIYDVPQFRLLKLFFCVLQFCQLLLFIMCFSFVRFSLLILCFSFVISEWGGNAAGLPSASLSIQCTDSRESGVFMYRYFSY